MHVLASGECHAGLPGVEVVMSGPVRQQQQLLLLLLLYSLVAPSLPASPFSAHAQNWLTLPVDAMIMIMFVIVSRLMWVNKQGILSGTCELAKI